MNLNRRTEWLFFHLWKNNPKNKSPCPGILIPSTIFYRWTHPHVWYKVSQRSQKIIRRNSEKIDLEHIFSHLTHDLGASKICGKYYYEGKVKKRLNEATGAHDKEVIKVEYFEKEQLRNFLNTRKKYHPSLLQKFIEPEHGNNEIIEVIWSPQFSVQTRRQNIHKAANLKIPVLDRITTFDGPEHVCISGIFDCNYSEEGVKSPISIVDFERMCLNMVNHIQDVSSGNTQISEMVLHFKIDSKSRIWLLYCKSLKLKNFANLDEFEYTNSRKLVQNRDVKIKMVAWPTPKFMSYDKISNHFRLNKGNFMKLSKKKITSNCPICLKKESKFYTMKMDVLTKLEYENKEQYLKVMRRFWGELSEERLEDMEKNVSFKDLEVRVCMECFLELSDSAKVNGDDEFNQYLKRMLKRDLDLLKKDRRGKPVVAKDTHLDAEKFDVDKDLKNSTKGFSRRMRMHSKGAIDNLDYKARIHEQFEEVFKKKNPDSSMKNIADIILLSIKNRKRVNVKRFGSNKNVLRAKSKEIIQKKLAPLIKVTGKLRNFQHPRPNRRIRGRTSSRFFRKMRLKKEFDYDDLISLSSQMRSRINEQDLNGTR